MAKRGVIFKQAPVIAPKRSWCDDSAKHDTSCNFGELIVGHVSDHMAHDVVKLKSSSYGFVEAMLAPSFGKCDVFSYWFYVNKRHIWPDWKKFRPNNDQLLTWEQMRSFVSPTMPYITLNHLRGDSDVFMPSAAPIIIDSGDGYRISFNSSIMNYFGVAVFRITTEGIDKVLHFKVDLVTDDIRKLPEARWQHNSGDIDIAVIYRRNLQEVQSLGGNLWHTYDSLVESMNIFSAGNLFNYMDLNISDCQKDRSYYFGHILSRLLREYIDNNTLSSSDMSFDFDLLYRFMNNHFVCSMMGISLGDSYLLEDYPIFIFDDSYGYLYGDDGKVSDDTSIGFTKPNALIESMVDSLSRLSKVWKVELDTRINTLPIRAYEYIYDEYFRDQNWIPVNTYTDFTRSGLESYETAEQIRYFSIRKKCWSHDPYTSSLPGPQRGDAIRFLSDASIKVDMESTAPSPAFANRRTIVVGVDSSNNIIGLGANSNQSGNANFAVDLSVDLSGATIEAFRIANARQKYEELFARTGGRYVEWQKGVMGANISDIEDERPIYIYGSRNPIQIAQVVQTSSTNVETDQPLGDLAGRGVYQGKGDYIEFDCPDDGILMQIICVVPQQSYQSGIAPIFTRHNWLDYPIPMFSQLGEEHVKTQTLWFTGNRDQDEKSFGYQSRYWDWKYSRDRVSGQLQNDLDYWTFAREFENEPVNGRDFLEVNVDYRQFAVQDRGVHHIYLSLYCDIQKNQALPVFGIPTL